MTTAALLPSGDAIPRFSLMALSGKKVTAGRGWGPIGCSGCLACGASLVVRRRPRHNHPPGSREPGCEVRPARLACIRRVVPDTDARPWEGFEHGSARGLALVAHRRRRGMVAAP